MANRIFELDATQIEKLEEAIKNYPGSVEDAINEILHGVGGELIQETIQNLMPKSNRKPWKGKKPHAKDSKSLRGENSNLAVTVKTTKNYQYLYFPDDGSNTINHAGNQQFFLRGAEAKQDEIIDRCVSELVSKFEQAV